MALNKCSDLKDEAVRKQQAERQKGNADRIAADFDSNGAAAMASARVALEKGDLDSAKAMLGKWPGLANPELIALQSDIGAKIQAQASAQHKSELIEAAKTLKSSDGSEGVRVFGELSKLEPDNKDYIAKLTQFQKVKDRQDAAAKKTQDIALRKAMAKAAEENFLSNGFSADVTTRGKDSTVLHIKFALVSKAFAFQVSRNGEFIGNLRKAGFTEVRMTDGFNDNWMVDLTK